MYAATGYFFPFIATSCTFTKARAVASSAVATVKVLFVGCTLICSSPSSEPSTVVRNACSRLAAGCSSRQSPPRGRNTTSIVPAGSAASCLLFCTTARVARSRWFASLNAVGTVADAASGGALVLLAFGCAGTKAAVRGFGDEFEPGAR